MSQFTLYENENKSSKKAYPYFVDVQSDLICGLNSRVVIPLSVNKNLVDINVKGLCPVFNVQGNKCVLLTQQMTSVPISMLKKKVCVLDNYRYEILGAIDILLTGI